MRFVYNPNAGEVKLQIDGKSFKHLFVSQRKKEGDILKLQNLKDNFAYHYKVVSISKKHATAVLEKKEQLPEQNITDKTVALAVIDPKELKEATRALAQIGQKKFLFFYAQRSQTNYKINKEKLKEIIIQSYEISGLNTEPEIEIYKSLDELLEKENGNIFMLDVDGEHIDDLKSQTDILLVGPEGGFTEQEKSLFKSKIASFSHNLTLTAKVAAVSALAKLVL